MFKSITKTQISTVNSIEPKPLAVIIRVTCQDFSPFTNFVYVLMPALIKIAYITMKNIKPIKLLSNMRIGDLPLIEKSINPIDKPNMSGTYSGIVLFLEYLSR